MNKKTIHSNHAPKAIGPYAQAVAGNGLLFVSGQLGINPETGDLPEGLEEQTKQSLANIDAILKEAGTSPDFVLKTTVYLVDLTDFNAVNKIYGDYFRDPYPARACFAVKQLPKNARVEIECVAMVD